VKYPDDVIIDISHRLTAAHWLVLELLSCELVDDPLKSQSLILLPPEKVPALTLTEIHQQTTLTPNFFRQHVAYLEGAGAIDLIIDRNDSRRRPAMITENGYRMVQLRVLQNGGA